MQENNTLKAQWLEKLSVSAWRPFKNWRHRLIVLEPDRLTWNRSPTEGSANGQVKPLMLSYFSNGMFLRT